MLPSCLAVCSECGDDKDIKPVISNTIVVSSALHSTRHSPSKVLTQEEATENLSACATSVFSEHFNHNSEGSSTGKLPSPPSSPTTCDSVPEDCTEAPTFANKPLRVYGKWSSQEQRLLVQLWCEHYMSVSRSDPPKWKEIAEQLSVKRKITGTQCQRKMKYLRDLYKEAKTYNEENSHLSLDDLKTSPFYREIDSILGCRDTANSSYGEEGNANHNSASVAPEVNPTATTVSVPMFVPPQPRRVYVADREDTISFSTPARLAYWGSIERSGNAAETEHSVSGQRRATNNTPEIETRRKRRKKNQDSTRDKNDDQESAVFRETMEKLQAQGDRIAAAMEGMLKTQSQQFELMTQFMNNFLQQMKHQMPEDH